MPNIGITVSGNATGWSKTAKGVEDSIGGLGKMAAGLKGQLAAAFGTAAIISGIKNVIDFADNMVDGAEAVGVTTDNFQALTIIAREAGASLDIFTKLFEKIAKASEDALGGSSKDMLAFTKLGLSQSDLLLNKVERLKKIASGALALPRGEAETALRGIGIKNAPQFMAMAPSISGLDQFTQDKKNVGSIASPEDLVALAEFKDSMEELMNSIKVFFVPILSGVMTLFIRFKQGFEIFFIGMTAMVKNGVSNIKNLLTGHWTKIKSTREAIREALTDKLVEQANDDKMRSLRKQNHIDSILAGANVTDVSGDIPYKSDNAVKNLSSPGNLKIGGLLGVDLNYRIQRLTEDMLNVAKESLKVQRQTEVNTRPTDTPSPFIPTAGGSRGGVLG